MANTDNDRFLDRFTIKWQREIGPYAGYPRFTNTIRAGSNGLCWWR